MMKENWHQGEHLSSIAQTGEGKTTCLGGLCRTRRYVLTLDAKGGDRTLNAFGDVRLDGWPGERKMNDLISKNEEDGLPSRFVIGGYSRTLKELDRLAGTLEQCLHEAYAMGGWTINADELQILTDRRMMNLGAILEKMLVSARDRGISLVSAFQSPSWVPPNASRQATWVSVTRTRDRETVQRLSEIVGRPREELAGALAGLERHHFIFVNRNPYEPMYVTVPDYIAPKEVVR